MIRRIRALLIAAPLAACAVAPTPAPPLACLAERGIGGTGAPLRVASDRGIGGTGVVGAITGFGSICVNGLKLAYDPAITVETATGPIEATALRIGHIVTAVTGTGANAATAHRLSLVHAVRGPVESATAGRAQVAGQQITTTTRVAGIDLLRPGNWVAVSGLRRADGTIVANRIEPAEPGEATITGLVAGPVTGAGAARSIGAARLLDAHIDPGEIATVSGPYAAGVMHVTGARTEPARPFGLPLGAMVVEAYITTDGNRLRLGQGLAVKRGPNLPPIATDTFAVVDLVDDGGELVAVGLHDAPGLEANGAATPPGATHPATHPATTATATATATSSTTATRGTTTTSSHFDDHSQGTTGSTSGTGTSSGGSATSGGSGSGTSSGSGSSGSKDSGTKDSGGKDSSGDKSGNSASGTSGRDS